MQLYFINCVPAITAQNSTLLTSAIAIAACAVFAFINHTISLVNNIHCTNQRMTSCMYYFSTCMLTRS